MMMRNRVTCKRLVAFVCAAASIQGAVATTNSIACLSPPNGVSATEWTAKAEALGLHLCVSVADSLDVAANQVQQRRFSSVTQAQPSDECEDEILSFMCAASSAQTSDDFACSVQSSDGNLVESNAFRTCIAPLCEEICIKNDGANGKDATFCTACASRRRGRFGSEFGAIWPSATINPLNLNAMFTQFASQPLGQLMTSYLRVQATMWLIRTAFQAIQQASGGGGGTTLFPNLGSPAPSTPSGGSSTIYFPPISPSPSPSPSPSNQCGVSAPASHSCSNSCGLCVFPDASSDVPNCCCDSTCSDYGDCCVDATDCCPALKSANGRLIRARSRPNARLRGSSA